MGIGTVPIWSQQSCRITAVSDGDTMTANCGGAATRIRLSSVDAPEKDQPYGQEAKELTAQLVLDQTVQVQTLDLDRYGRTVARVTLPDGRDLARELVAGGAAWHYVQYSRDPELGPIETRARSTKAGLWASVAPMPPSQFRRQARKSGSSNTGWSMANASTSTFFTFKPAVLETFGQPRFRIRRSERRTLVRGR